MERRAAIMPLGSPDQIEPAALHAERSALTDALV
jgi:hypothetical protein